MPNILSQIGKKPLTEIKKDLSKKLPKPKDDQLTKNIISSSKAKSSNTKKSSSKKSSTKLKDSDKKTTTTTTTTPTLDLDTSIPKALRDVEIAQAANLLGDQQQYTYNTGTPEQLGVQQVQKASATEPGSPLLPVGTITTIPSEPAKGRTKDTRYSGYTPSSSYEPTSSQTQMPSDLKLDTDAFKTPLEQMVAGTPFESQFEQQKILTMSSGQAEQDTKTWLNQKTINENIPRGRPINITYETADGTIKTISDSSSNLNDRLKSFNNNDYYIINIEDQQNNQTYYDTPSRSDIQSYYQNRTLSYYDMNKPLPTTPTSITKDQLQNLENQYRSGNISTQDFQQQSIYLQALNTKPDYYQFVKDRDYANIITDFSLGNLSEKKAQEKLQTLNQQGMQNAPITNVEKWGSRFLDYNPEKEGIQTISDIQKEEPAITGVSYDPFADEGKRFQTKFDYGKGADILTEQMYQKSKEGKTYAVPQATDIMSRVGGITSPLWEGAGSFFRIVTGQAGTPQEEYDKVIGSYDRNRYNLMKGWTESQRAYETGQGDQWAFGKQAIQQPIVTDIFLPYGLGAGFRAASPLARGIVQGSSKLSRASGVVSRAAQKVPRLARGTKYAGYGLITSPMWVPPVATGVAEYQGQVEPGTTASQGARALFQLGMFGLGSRGANIALQKPSSRYPGFTREQALYQRSSRLPYRYQAFKESLGHAIRHPRGYYELQRFGTPGTASYSVQMDRVSPFGSRSRLSESEFFTQPRVIRKGFTMRDPNLPSYVDDAFTYSPPYQEKTVAHYMQRTTPPKGETTLFDFAKQRPSITKTTTSDVMSQMGLKQGIPYDYSYIMTDAGPVIVPSGTTRMLTSQNPLTSRYYTPRRWLQQKGVRITPKKTAQTSLPGYNTGRLYIDEGPITLQDFYARGNVYGSVMQGQKTIPIQRTIRPSVQSTLDDWGVFGKEIVPLEQIRGRLGGRYVNTTGTKMPGFAENQPWNTFWSEFEPTKSVIPTATSGGGIIGKANYQVSPQRQTMVQLAETIAPTRPGRPPVAPLSGTFYKPVVPKTRILPIISYQPLMGQRPLQSSAQGYLPTLDKIQMQEITPDLLSKQALRLENLPTQTPITQPAYQTIQDTTQTPAYDTTQEQLQELQQKVGFFPALQPLSYQAQIAKPKPPEKVNPTPFDLPEDEEEPETPKQLRKISPYFSIYKQESRYYATPKIWKAPEMTRRRLNRENNKKNMFFSLVK